MTNMGWFSSICRNMGLMVHNIKNPEGKPPVPRKVVKTEVQEERKGNMILRRTTIEEIEIRPEDANDDTKDAG